MNYNKVMIGGRLTRDVELKYTPSNVAVANLGIASNRKFKKGDGSIGEEVCFMDCEAWGKTAETLSRFFQKGRSIFIEGRLRFDQWDDNKTGTKRSKLKIIVENWQFVDQKPEGGGGGGGGGGNENSRGSDRDNYDYNQDKGGSTGDGSQSQQQHQPLSEDQIPF